jgi:polysaccharide biosynthesis transport protein
MDLLYLFRSLLKRKWIIIGTTLLALCATAAFLLLKKREYSSTAQYSTGFTIQQVSLVNEEFNPYEADNKFSNVLETFISPKVIGMLSYHLLLHDLRNNENHFKILSERQLNSKKYKAVDQGKAIEILTSKIDSLELLTSFNPEEKKILELLEVYEYDYKTLKEILDIERIPRTDYLVISFKSENPYLSAYVVNKIGSEFLRFYNSLNSTLTTQSVEKIANIVDQKKKQVDSITENLRKEKSTQGALDPTELSKSAMQTVTQLNSKLADEKSSYNNNFYQLQSVNNQLANLSTSNNNLPASVEGNNQEIVRIRNKLRELAPFKDDPKIADQIKKLQDDLKNRESVLNTPTGSANNNLLTRNNLLASKSDLEEQLKATDQTIGYLTSEIAKYSAYSNAGVGNEVKINALRSEVDIATKEYSDIKSKFMQAEGFKETPTINFRQTLLGQPAIEPEPRHLIIILGIVGPCMFTFVSLLIILLELLDSSVKSPSRFFSTVGLYLLSPVSRVNFKKENIEDIFNHQTIDTNKRSSKNFVFISSLRKLRFEIENSEKKVLLITSTRIGEGKTILMEAIARSFSMVNKKILIIDTNFSHNSISAKFSVENHLEDFKLAPDRTDIVAFKHIIYKTSNENLDVVCCKGGNYTPEEILGKNNLLQHLKTLTIYYDYVFLEGAALNNYSDSRELSKYVDGIIAVFAADSGINEMDKESIQFLTSKGDQFIGCILNKVEVESIDI